MLGKAKGHLANLWSLRRSRLATHLLWSASGQLVVALTGAVGIRILTELAPPRIFGEANLVMAAMNFAVLVGISPVTNTQLRYHAKFNAEGEGAGFTGEIMKAAAAAAALLAVLVGVIYAGWMFAHGRGADWAMGAAVLAWVPIYALRNVLIGRVFAERRQRLAALWQSLEAVLVLGLSALLLWLWGTSEAYVSGTILSVLLLCLLVLFFSARERAIRFDGLRLGGSKTVRGLISHFGLPFVAIGMLNWLGNLSERYAVAGLLGLAESGVYAASFGISSRMLLLIPLVTTSAWRPALFEAAATAPARAARIYRAWMAFTAVAAAVAVVGLWLTSPFVAALLLAPEYRQAASYLIPLIALGFGFQAMNQVIESRVMSLGHSRRLILPPGCGGLGNLLVALILIPRIGILGAAFASASGFFIQFVVTSLVLRGLLRRAPTGATPLADSPDETAAGPARTASI